MGHRRPRVVVAGQLPPPLSGQHLAVGWNREELAADGRFDVDLWEFRFAERMEDQGLPSLAKVVELARAMGRLAAVRRRGPIDVLLYPISGTSTGAVLRDLALLPPARLASRRLVLRFHGAGHRAWDHDRRLLVRVARWVMGRADAAIANAEANTVDPHAAGIRQVHVVTHRIDDALDHSLVRRDRAPGDPVRVAYVGHLGAQRATDELIAAVGGLADEGIRIELELGGNPRSPYSAAAITAQAARWGIADRVSQLGPVDGRSKDELFGRAHLFAFPTVFAAESFGLVLAEALCWGLPVVASDWRANGEVLAGTDHVLHPVAPDLAGAIADGLRTAVKHLDDGTWPTFSARNRAVYEGQYQRRLGPGTPLAEVVAEIVAGDR